jgi:hypothetical protein
VGGADAGVETEMYAPTFDDKSEAKYNDRAT